MHEDTSNLNQEGYEGEQCPTIIPPVFSSPNIKSEQRGCQGEERAHRRGHFDIEQRVMYGHLARKVELQVAKELSDRESPVDREVG